MIHMYIAGLCVYCAEVQETNKSILVYHYEKKKVNNVKIKLYVLIAAQKWGKTMNGMSGRGPGYKQKVIITPYMHNMIYHVPNTLRLHGSIRIFSGQGN